MKIADLHKTQLLDVEALVAAEVKRAIAAFPGAKGDPLTALAFASYTLTKNLAERTAERDARPYK